MQKAQKDYIRENESNRDISPWTTKSYPYKKLENGDKFYSTNSALDAMMFFLQSKALLTLSSKPEHFIIPTIYIILPFCYATHVKNQEETEMEYNAIEKALLVLSYFAKGNHPIGTVELSEQLCLNKTTINRTMNTLKRHNFLEQNPKTKQYSLGPMVALLGKSITQSLDGQTAIIAQPYCDRLRDQVGETVHIEILSGNHVYLAYASRGLSPVSVEVSVGDMTYPNAHAGAKAITAFSDPEQIDKRLNNGLKNLTDRSVTDPSKLRHLYKEIVKNGISIDDGEYEEQIYAIGAPIFDNNCRAVAGIVILAPYMRKKDLERQHVIRAIKETANLISSRLLCPKKYEEVCNSHLKRIGK